MSKTPEKTGKRDQKGKTLSLDSLCTKELIDVKLDNEFEKVRGVLLIILFGLVTSVVGFKLGERQSEVRWRRIMGDSGEVDLSLMWEVWSRLDKSYLHSDEIEKEKMVLGAISGSTAALDDPYTSFFSS